LHLSNAEIPHRHPAEARIRNVCGGDLSLHRAAGDYRRGP
jgi:hypothetical protein